MRFRASRSEYAHASHGDSQCRSGPRSTDRRGTPRTASGACIRCLPCSLRQPGAIAGSAGSAVRLQDGEVDCRWRNRALASCDLRASCGTAKVQLGLVRYKRPQAAKREVRNEGFERQRKKKGRGVMGRRVPSLWIPSRRTADGLSNPHESMRRAQQRGYETKGLQTEYECTCRS